MKVIVTGGCGFIGAHIVRHLLATTGHEIYVLDDFSGCDRSVADDLFALPGARDRLKVHDVDLRDCLAVSAFFSAYEWKDGFDCYYLASAAHEGRSFFTPILNVSRNSEAYNVFLTYAIKNGLNKVVVFSSMSRYGDGEGGKYQPPFTEDLPTVPLDPYAASKVMMESLTRCQSRVFDFDWTIVVPHNVFGEGQCYWDPYRNVLILWMGLILLDKQPPVIYGDGLQQRAFSYIGDSLEPMVRSMWNEGCDGEVINIGGIKEYTVLDAWKAVKEVSGYRGDAQFMPDRPSEAKKAFCSFDKSVRLLDYRENVGFYKGLERMWQWVKSKGPRPFQYVQSLEIQNDKTPTTWTKKLF